MCVPERECVCVDGWVLLTCLGQYNLARHTNILPQYKSSHFATFVVSGFTLHRFEAQDDAGGPERRRADQGLPSTWS